MRGLVVVYIVALCREVVALACHRAARATVDANTILWPVGLVSRYSTQMLQLVREPNQPGDRRGVSAFTVGGRPLPHHAPCDTLMDTALFDISGGCEAFCLELSLLTIICCCQDLTLWTTQGTQVEREYCTQDSCQQRLRAPLHSHQ